MQQLSKAKQFEPDQPLWNVQTIFEGLKAPAFGVCLNWEFFTIREGLHPWHARLLGHLINLTSQEGRLEELVMAYKDNTKELRRVANGFRQAIMAFIELKQSFREACATCSTYEEQDEFCDLDNFHADENELIQAIDTSNCTHIQGRYLFQSLRRDGGQCQLTHMVDPNYKHYVEGTDSSIGPTKGVSIPIIRATPILPPYDDKSNLHVAIELLHCLSPGAFRIDDLRGNAVNNPKNILSLRPEHRTAFDTFREWIYTPQEQEAHYQVEAMDYQEVVSQVLLAPSQEYYTSTIAAVSPNYLAFHAMLARAYQASGVGLVFLLDTLESTKDMEWLAAIVSKRNETKT